MLVFHSSMQKIIAEPESEANACARCVLCTDRWSKRSTIARRGVHLLADFGRAIALPATCNPSTCDNAYRYACARVSQIPQCAREYDIRRVDSSRLRARTLHWRKRRAGHTVVRNDSICNVIDHDNTTIAAATDVDSRCDNWRSKATQSTAACQRSTG